MSILLQRQMRHLWAAGKLITRIYDTGYAGTWGQTLRTQAEADANAKDGSGISHSLHILKLAMDLNLFKDGVELKTVEAFRPFGEYWKSLDVLCCWGGDFHSPDADHFSITFGGVK